MPTEPHKPIIFISYAHADEPEKPAEGEIKWLSFVTGYLRPAVKHGAVDIWVDRLMRGGDSVDPEIEHKLRACDIFILLVSRHSLSSDYIVGKEIAIIRERQARGEDVHFYPLVLTPTPRIALDLVRDKNLRPRDGKPFSEYPLHERERHTSEAADEIAAIAEEIASRKRSAPALPPLQPSQSPAPTASTAPRAVVGSFVPKVSVALQGAGSKASAGEFAPVVIPSEIPPPPVMPIANKSFEASAPVGAPPLSPPAAEDGREAECHIEDQESLGAWLRGQSREAAVAIAERAALRVLPSLIPLAPGRANSGMEGRFSDGLCAVLRAHALARVAARFPERADELRGVGAYAATRLAVRTAAENFGEVYERGRGFVFAEAVRASIAPVIAALYAVQAASSEGAFESGMETGFDASLTASIDAAAAVEAAAQSVVADSRKWFWEDLSADVQRLAASGPAMLGDAPLWPSGSPNRAPPDWSALRRVLPAGEDWEVWIDWYEERLRGGSRGEVYELVFASVPQNVWDEGASAGNRWIREHLPPAASKRDQTGPGAVPQTADRRALLEWLKSQSREVASAIATRVTLRVVPLLARYVPDGSDLSNAERFKVELTAIFRANALCWIAARFRERADERRSAGEYQAASMAVRTVAEYPQLLRSSAGHRNMAEELRKRHGPPKSAMFAVQSAFGEPLIASIDAVAAVEAAAWRGNSLRS